MPARWFAAALENASQVRTAAIALPAGGPRPGHGKAPRAFRGGAGSQTSRRRAVTTRQRGGASRGTRGKREGRRLPSKDRCDAATSTPRCPRAAPTKALREDRVACVRGARSRHERIAIRMRQHDGPRTWAEPSRSVEHATPHRRQRDDRARATRPSRGSAARTLGGNRHAHTMACRSCRMAVAVES
jgi:hypothetical protein